MVQEKDYKMEIKIKRKTDWNEVLDSCRWTVNKLSIDKEPSDKFKYSILKAEHSPIRELLFVVEIYDIPTWVSQHIARHDAFSGHNQRDGAKDTNFVATQRSDRTGRDRNKLPQDTPCCHRIFLSAQDFITISRKRLCNRASKGTRDVWRAIIDKLAETEPIIAHFCVKECVYRGGICPEEDSCKYNQTPDFSNEFQKYQSYE